MANICPICLANIDMVGKVHRCVPKAVNLDLPVKCVRALATYQYRDPEKRRAYMRDYMRKRRASAHT